MKDTQAFLQSRTFKFLVPFVIALSIIQIFKSGYAFGQWLFDVLH